MHITKQQLLWVNLEPTMTQIQYWANLMAAVIQISNTKWKQSHYIK